MIMGGATRLWWTCIVLLSIELGSDAHMTLCPKPVITPNTKVFPFGSNGTLTCLGCNGSVTWSRQSQTQRPYPKNVFGGLVLKNIRYKDVDNYTCSKNGVPMCTVQLLVSEELEQPVVRCILRHPGSNIKCEWRPQRSLPSGVRTTLKVQKSGMMGWPPLTRPCSYSRSAKTFSCVLRHEEDHSSKFIITLCVTSRTDSRDSNASIMDANSLLQPDPPVNVTASPMERSPTKLTVSWLYPPSWNKEYYKLEFEIHYWIENTNLEMTLGPTEQTSLLITDALMGRKHRVKVRAREEFGHGTWSDWSQAAEGTPWSDPALPESPNTPIYTEYYSDGYTSSEEQTSSEEHTSNEAGPSSVQTSRTQRYNFLVAGASLTLVICLFIGMFLRQSHWRQRGAAAGGKLRFLFLPLREGARSELQPSGSLLMAPGSLGATERPCIPAVQAGD